MARVVELLVGLNALMGIATFLGLRFVFNRGRDKASGGLDRITGRTKQQPPDDVDE